MIIATYVVAISLAAAMAIAALADVRKWPPPMKSVRKGIVKESTLPFLTAVKSVGALGIVVGLFVHWAGIAAAVGCVVYFVLAIGAHLRKRDWDVLPATGYLALSVAALVLFSSTQPQPNAPEALRERLFSCAMIG
jgi:asparagine N-glycosylation enzyme membrane subunit Stt3